MNRNDYIESPTISRKYMIIFLVVSIVTVGLFVAFKPMQHDETEFYQSAWLMAQGKCIYKDFFQHHHPLAYWLYEPLLKIMPPIITFQNIIILRLPGVVIFLATIACLYSLYRKIFSPTVALVGVFLLMTWSFYLISSLFARPDNLMNLCLILAMCAIFKKETTGAGVGRWLLCGLLCGLAFCFLQKALPFIALLFMILVSRGWRGTESWKTLPAFVFGGLITCGIFLVLVDRFYGLEQYWKCCWQFNLVMPKQSIISTSRITRWIPTLMYALIPAWGLLGIFYAFKYRVKREFAIIALLGGYGSFLLAPYGHSQYGTFMMAFSAPFAGLAFGFLYEKYGKMFLYAIIAVQNNPA